MLLNYLVSMVRSFSSCCWWYFLFCLCRKNIFFWFLWK